MPLGNGTRSVPATLPPSLPCVPSLPCLPVVFGGHGRCWFLPVFCVSAKLAMSAMSAKSFWPTWALLLGGTPWKGVVSAHRSYHALSGRATRTKIGVDMSKNKWLATAATQERPLATKYPSVHYWIEWPFSRLFLREIANFHRRISLRLRDFAWDSRKTCLTQRREGAKENLRLIANAPPRNQPITGQDRRIDQRRTSSRAALQERTSRRD